MILVRGCPDETKLTLNTLFRSNRYPNSTIPMIRQSFATKIISIVCGNEHINPNMAQYSLSTIPIMAQESSPKVYSWPNLVETYKRSVRRVYDVYAPNMWHTHLLDRSLKSLHFHFGENLGQPAWSTSCLNV